MGDLGFRGSVAESVYGNHIISQHMMIEFMETSNLATLPTHEHWDPTFATIFIFLFLLLPFKFLLFVPFLFELLVGLLKFLGCNFMQTPPGARAFQK